MLSVLFLMVVCSDEEAVATNLEIAHKTASSSSRHDSRLESGERYKSSINGGYTLVGGNSLVLIVESELRIGTCGSFM
jgi:hypothetical protein